MRGWIKSDSVRANNHWQSGSGGSGFNILSDDWHKVMTAGGITTWMVDETNTQLINNYQLGQPGGGLIGCGKVVGVYKTSDSPYTGETGKLYNQTIEGLADATNIYVKYTCVRTPNELKEKSFLFAPAQGSIIMRNYTSSTAFTGISTYNSGYYYYNVADKEMTATTTSPTKYYVTMNGEGDSVTYTITPQVTGGNTLLLGGGGNRALFMVGCDARTLTGTWKWKIEVTT